MTRYRKKSVEVEAWQVGSDEPMPWWVKEELGTINGNIVVMEGGNGLAVFDTAVYKDWMPAYKGYYVIRENLRFYACPKEHFEQTYEVVE